MLSRIDLFGKAVEFNFNGGAKSRTRIGGFSQFYSLDFGSGPFTMLASIFSKEKTRQPSPLRLSAKTRRR